MRGRVRIAAGVAAAMAVIVFATSCAEFVDHGTFFEYTLTVNGLTNISASHIHASAGTTANANVIINLYIPNGPPFGAVDGVIATGTLTNANNPSFTVDALRALFIAGTAYVNVHTNPGFPAGAIRGQIARSN